MGIRKDTVATSRIVVSPLNVTHKICVMAIEWVDRSGQKLCVLHFLNDDLELGSVGICARARCGESHVMEKQAKIAIVGPLRDTVLVLGKTIVTVEFDANNPGLWYVLSYFVAPGRGDGCPCAVRGLSVLRGVQHDERSRSYSSDPA